MQSEERKKYIETLLRDQLAKILKLNPDKIGSKQDLNDLGIDSLMTLEMALLIQDEFGVEMTTMNLLKQSNLSELAENIIDKLFSNMDKPEEYINSDQGIQISSATG